jgi:dTDP-4-amino-4,6-dideoxygalactose transaminase
VAARFWLSDVDLGEEEAAAVADVVASKWLSVGERTKRFEEEFAAFVGAGSAVATSSCTAALHLALAGLGVGPGDEVLVPSYTFVATANAVRYVGATPVFVDICGAHDLNLDPADAAAKVTERTAAIVVVHLAGFPADMDAIMELAGRHGLAVVEDAAHAVGATYGGSGPLAGRAPGTIGDVGCYSFFANKNLVTGEGGMAVTDDAELGERIRLGRSHGMTRTSWDKASGRATDYDVVDLGFNYRPTELTAALGLVQLAKLPGAIVRRRELTERYWAHLRAVPGLTLPFVDRTDGAYHILPVVVAHAEMREPVRQRLDAAGIQTSVHYSPIHLFTHYRTRFPAPAVPATEDVAARELTLPLHPLLEDDDVDEIAAETAAAVTELG